MIAKLQRHDRVALDFNALRRIVENVAILSAHLFGNDRHARGQAINTDGAGAIGHIFAVGVADHAAIRIRYKKLYVGNGNAGHGVLFDDKQRAHLIISEGHGDNVLILTGEIDRFRGVGDDVPVRRGDLLTDVSACLEAGYNDGSIARSAVLADNRAARTGGAAEEADAEPCTLQRLTALAVHLADDDGGKRRIFKGQYLALATGNEAFLRGRLFNGIAMRRFQLRHLVPAVLDFGKDDLAAFIGVISAKII